MGENDRGSHSCTETGREGGRQEGKEGERWIGVYQTHNSHDLIGSCMEESLCVTLWIRRVWCI